MIKIIINKSLSQKYVKEEESIYKINRETNQAVLFLRLELFKITLQNGIKVIKKVFIVQWEF